MKPKVIFIDWDGTLSNSRFWQQWQSKIEHDAKYQIIQKVLFTDARDLLSDWMRGYRTVDSVMEYVAELSRIPYEELMTELQYSCENMNFIEDNVMTLIQQIRNKGMAVVIATDNMDTFSRWTAPALKLDKLFDDILLSVDRGALKTDTDADGTSAFFNHFFLSTGIKPKESLLIDDSRNNKAVERFGMNFQHVSNSEPLSTHLINFTQL